MTSLWHGGTEEPLQPVVPLVSAGVGELVGVGVGVGVRVGVGVGVGVGVDVRVGGGVRVGDGSRLGLGDRPGLWVGFGDWDLTVVPGFPVVPRLGVAARRTISPPREGWAVCLRPDRAWADAGGLADGAAVTEGTAGASAEVTGGGA
jgi:hypothetical protein